MKKPAIDPADLALERARQLKAVQLSRGGDEAPTDAATPEEPLSTVEPVAVDEPSKRGDNIGQTGKVSEKKTNLPKGRKTLENLRATLQAAREDCERICDALPDAGTETRIGQHYHLGSIGCPKADAMNSMRLSMRLSRPTSV